MMNKFHFSLKIKHPLEKLSHKLKIEATKLKTMTINDKLLKFVG